MNDRHEELANRAERGELRIKPGTIRRDEPARQAGREAALEVTGASTLAEATRIALGRPPVGGAAGPS
ncbi:MAG: hypothetical protein FWD11_02490 [Micrococcales bacterium]|nr:hypothetical protein [Micrococcales bacterium]